MAELDIALQIIKRTVMQLGVISFLKDDFRILKRKACSVQSVNGSSFGSSVIVTLLPWADSFHEIKSQCCTTMIIGLIYILNLRYDKMSAPSMQSITDKKQHWGGNRQHTIMLAHFISFSLPIHSAQN